MDADPEEAPRPLSPEASVTMPDVSPPVSPPGAWQADSLPAPSHTPPAPLVAAQPAVTGSILSLREMRFEMQRPLLDDIGRFLASHGLDVMPYTMTIAYDCVSGFNPRLSLQIQERTNRGEPITLSWLEDVARESGRSREESMISRLMGKLEESLEHFGQSTVRAKAATNEYNSALSEHVEVLEHADTPEAIANLVGLARAMVDRMRAIENELGQTERRAKLLKRDLEKVRKLADQDHLTGLPNRRAFEKLLDADYMKAKRDRTRLCVAFWDIDHFKRINDEHGHAAGDRVLKVVADILGRISDDRCYVARHGGEEFAVLFRGCNIDEAFDRLEAARRDLAGRQLINRLTDQPFGDVSFSAGLADMLEYPSKSAALKAADKALYRAKNDGRNRVAYAAVE